MFAFKRGNPEIGNSLGNAQPSWGQPGSAAWGVSGESSQSEHATACACPGELEFNGTGSS